MRSDLHGKNMTTIVPTGGTFTPKQLQLEKNSGKLYWSDREGMRVMRANLDGSEIETLVDTSLGDSRPGPDARKWCVGIAVDTDGGKFYWTQKGGHRAGLGRIFRAIDSCIINVLCQAQKKGAVAEEGAQQRFVPLQSAG